jgi:uncharacterized protein YdiU (UPF0061 family)
MKVPGQTFTYQTDTLQYGNRFLELPPVFYTRLIPTPVPSPYLVCGSINAAAWIGMDPAEFSSPTFVETFSGNRLQPGMQPLAAVYSGHQFGVWAGQLGDGRALLLGDVPAQDGKRVELQLKGGGPTPYSRMGDGRAVLRSSIREFLCSEAMAPLGVPTTRALCVTGSDMRVMREEPETAAVVTRMSESFVRFGSFEHWYYNNRHSDLKLLADAVLAQHYPDLAVTRNPYQTLLQEVTTRTAHMIAHWQAIGFMHGVMNTDNMSILGQTLDYGPFGFMEAFDANHICNHTDQQGRYSYKMQPQIGEWNCYALGQAMLPLIGTVEETEGALAVYKPQFAAKLDELLHAKLGLHTTLPEDGALITAMWQLLQDNHADFTLFFRRLGNLRCDDIQTFEPLRDLFIDRPAFDAWAQDYRNRLKQENSDDDERSRAMQRVNPKYVLRNYLAHAAIEKAQNKDFGEVSRLHQILRNPYDEQPENEGYAALPPDWASHLEVSCSS